MADNSTCLQSLLQEHLRNSPNKIAIRAGDQTLTYANLDRLVESVAAGLQSLGIAPGDRVAWLLPNCLEAVLVTLACYRAGAIVVPLNYRYVLQEVEDVTARVGAKVLIYHRDRASELGSLLTTNSFVSALEVGGENGQANDFGVWLLKEKHAITVPVKETDPALILFTSGSTGHPKGVVHSHQGAFAAIDQSRRLFEFSSSDVVLVGKSISHAGGLQTQMLPTLLAGGEVILSAKPTPAEAISLITTHQATEYGMLASDLLDFVEFLENKPTQLPSLNNAIGSGDSVPTDLHHRFRDCIGWEIMEGAGMTEVGCYYAANPRNGRRKWGSLGLAAPGIELRIVGPDGERCQPKESGEIVLRSPSVTMGYWNDDAATEALFREGWLHTGDLAYYDEDGYVWFVGRKKLMIIRRGSNIAPAEVECIVDEHPLVHASVVVGISDPRDGQIPVACVALIDQGSESTEQDIRQYVAQHLAAYKNPVHYLFLDELPRTSVGKFNRHTLAETAEHHFGAPG